MLQHNTQKSIQGCIQVQPGIKTARQIKDLTGNCTWLAEGYRDETYYLGVRE
jgi:hypothetical protein